MQRFGLALSGGGFRAAIYHLGVVRFLRDAGALSQISHITAVSGGSVLGAHLVLNWDRYSGTERLMPYAKGVSAKSHDFSCSSMCAIESYVDSRWHRW